MPVILMALQLALQGFADLQAVIAVVGPIIAKMQSESRAQPSADELTSIAALFKQVDSVLQKHIADARAAGL